MSMKNIAVLFIIATSSFIFPHTSPLLLIESLKKNLESIVFDFNKDSKISCSFGAYEYKEGDNLDSLIKKADEIMYEIKTQYKENKKE